MGRCELGSIRMPSRASSTAAAVSFRLIWYTALRYTARACGLAAYSAAYGVGRAPTAAMAPTARAILCAMFLCKVNTSLTSPSKSSPHK
jgi:hypothetical protein